MEYEVEGSRPKMTWKEVVREDCQAHKLNKEDAVDRCKWRKVIMEVHWSGWVWVGECFFWYRPARVVPNNTHTHTHPFNGPFSGTTQVSHYQKGKTNLDFTEASDSECQWNQLGHMQVCTLLQTDNHTSTPSLCFLHAGCPSCRPTNSVKALKAQMTVKWLLLLLLSLTSSTCFSLKHFTNTCFCH